MYIYTYIYNNENMFIGINFDSNPSISIAKEFTRALTSGCLYTYAYLYIRYRYVF
jgi:hypothetical protein